MHYTSRSSRPSLTATSEQPCHSRPLRRTTSLMRGEGHPVHLYRPPLGPVNTNHSNKVKVRHRDVTEFVGGERKEGRKERKQLDKWTVKRSRNKALPCRSQWKKTPLFQHTAVFCYLKMLLTPHLSGIWWIKCTGIF